MEKVTILLVDDEVDFIKTLSERLSIRGFENTVVHDGETALQIIESDHPAVVVLDLKMPGVDGMEVLRKIREDEKTVKVIILTGHGTDREEGEASQLGVEAFLRKPVDIEVLIECLQSAEVTAAE